MQDEVQKDSVKSLIDENSKFTNELMNVLLLSEEMYKAEDVVNLIEKQGHSTRLMYGQISVSIFVMNDKTLDILLNRVENLAQQTTKESVRKILCKLYDHIDLATHQVQKINEDMQRSAENAAEEARDKIEQTLDEKIKQTEKTYITTFATVASILFGLVGGLAFSFQAINRVGSQDFFGLLSVICLVGAFIIGVLAVLIWLILPLTHREIPSEKLPASKRFCLFSCAIITFLIVASVIFAILNSREETSISSQLLETFKHFIATNQS